MKSLRSMGIFLVICFIVIVLVLADRAYGNDIIRAEAEAVSSVEIQAVPDIWSSGRIVITEADKVDKLIKVLNSFEYDGMISDRNLWQADTFIILYSGFREERLLPAI